MGTRQQLHDELLTLAPNAYYQPPSSAKMRYPCFVYKLARIKNLHADNRIYKTHTCYTVSYIATSVNDGIISEMLTKFPYCRFDRSYPADELHHYVFDLFY